GNEETNLRNAIVSYDDLIESANGNNFNKIPDARVRSFAVIREVESRLAKWHADSMFVDAVTSSTVTTPYLLQSWICRKGMGPIIILPELTDDEVTVLRSKNDSLVDANNLPTTWQAMCELWEKQVHDDDLTEDEV